MEFVKFLMEHREGNSTLTRKGYKYFPEKSHLMKWDAIKVHMLCGLFANFLLTRSTLNYSKLSTRTLPATAEKRNQHNLTDHCLNPQLFAMYLPLLVSQKCVLVYQHLPVQVWVSVHAPQGVYLWLLKPCHLVIYIIHVPDEDVKTIKAYCMLCYYFMVSIFST